MSPAASPLGGGTSEQPATMSHVIIAHIGGVRVGFEDTRDLRELLAGYLAGPFGSSGPAPHLVFRFGGGNPEPRGQAPTQVGRFRVSIGASDQADSAVAVQVGGCGRPYPLVPSSLFRVAHPAYLSRRQYLALAFIDQVLNPLLQVIGAQRGQSFIHASVVQKRDRRVAVVGPGGTGKTPVMLRLLEAGWKFLSDDWTVISANGTVHRAHQAINVHSADLRHEWMRELLLPKLSKPDRFSWNLRVAGSRTTALRRYVLADTLLPPAMLGAEGRLTEVFIVEREETNRVVESYPAAGQAATAATDLTLQEVRTLDQILGAAAHVKALPLTETGAVESATLRVLTSAFSTARITVLTVPARAPESEVAKMLYERIET